MRLNVTSEIGRLKSVLVHLPGREIDLMVPPMMAQLLFDDILYGQVAREEHRRFQQLIRFVADEVLDLQDLLEEVLEDEDVKEHIVRDLGKRNRLGRKLVSALLEERPAALAEVLISGIARETKSGELPQFDLYPIPNLFFMRDPQIVLGDRVVVSAMATQARRRESLLSKYVFENHPHFKRDDIFWLDFMDTEPERPISRKSPTLEGGDVLIPRRDLLLIGVTERTSKAGVEALMRSLKEQKAGIRSVIIVDVPRQRSFMHLDTIFTFISRNECLIYPPVILPSGSQAAKVTTVDLTKKVPTYTEQKSLLGALRRRDSTSSRSTAAARVPSISNASSGPTERMRSLSRRASSCSTSATSAPPRRWPSRAITSFTRTICCSAAPRWRPGRTKSTRCRSPATSSPAPAAARAA